MKFVSFIVALLFLFSFNTSNAQGMVVGETTGGVECAVGLDYLTVGVALTDSTVRFYNTTTLPSITFADNIDSLNAQSEHDWIKVTIVTTKGIYTAGQEVMVNRKAIQRITKNGDDTAYIRMRALALSFNTDEDYDDIVIDIINGI